jgi:hypothetical protein
MLKKLVFLTFVTISCSSLAYQLMPPSQPESIISVPDIDETDNKIDYDQYWIYRNDYSVNIGEKDQKVKGFGFINSGGNSVVIPPEINPGEGPSRFYSFTFKDRARQDIQMWVSDIADASVSNYLESAFYFFPRHVLPAIEVDSTNSNRWIVTLPTRETIAVDRTTKVILSGVLKEDQPLDMNPIASKRKYADISYSGSGLFLRANMRANSPQLAKTATVYLQGKICQVPGADVFNQSTSGAMTFKYATDKEFNGYLLKKCQFGIPGL